MSRRPRRRAPLGAHGSASARNPHTLVRTALLVIAATVVVGLTAALSSAVLPAPSTDGPRSLLSDARVRAAAERTAEAAKQRAERRDTGAARAERRASRDRFAGASDAEALDIVRDELPRLLGRPAYRPLRGSDGDVDRYLGADDQSALLDTGDGERTIVESMLPLRGQTADGDEAPVDLALEERDGAFEPKSAPVRTNLPADISDGVALPYDGGTLRVGALGMAGDASRQSGDDLFYANAAHDTDLVATALATGAELSDVVRSPGGPETFAYSFSGLPEGAELKPTADGGAVVIDGDARIAVVAPPTAQGADGDPVPVELAVDGSRLELRVAHRQRDVAYPLVVDPVIETFTWQQASNNDFNGWAYSYAPGAGSPAHASGLTSAHGGVYGGGLYTYTNGNYMYSTDQGFNKFAAPGDAYVYRADFNLANWNYTPTAPMCTSAGIFTGTTAQGPFWANCGNYVNTTWGTCASGTHPNCSTSAGAGGNDAESNFWAYGNAPRAAWSPANGTGAFSYTGIATVYVNDRVNPQVQWSGDPPGSDWGRYSDTYSVLATDSGLGVKQVTARAPVTAPSWSGATLNTGCAGTRFNRAANPNPCANPKTLNFNLSTLPEGPQTLRLAASDAVDNPGSFDYSIKVDRTGPTLTNTGSLKAAAGGDVTDGRYTLHAVAGGETNRSGVQSIEVTVDGTQVATQSQTCPSGGCGMTLTPDYVFVGEQFAEGEHEVEVKTTDFAANTTTDSWTVTVHHSAAADVGPGSINLTTGAFTLGAMDVSDESAGQGLAVNRIYTSRAQAGGAASIFGPGWSSGLPVGGAGGDYSALRIPDDLNPNVEIVTADGSNLAFTPGQNNTYASPDGSEDLTLTFNDSLSQFELRDTGGNLTVFRQVSGATDWVPTKVQEAPSNTTTNFTYDASGRVKYAIAPAPSGVTCTPAATALVTRGCRTLTLVYATTTTATGNTSGTWGDFAGQLARADLTAWDPASGVMTTTAVAQYQYGLDGRLRTEWDPRISPALKTTYGYDTPGHLTSVTPPGKAGFNLAYGSIASDPDTGRLKSASRTGPNGTATTTVAYDVPLSGSGAPNQMAASNVSVWGQTDIPASATAIFPPDQVPADPPTSWTRATVHYLDAKSRAVNIAAPGGQIQTSEYDSHGNRVRQLSASNRARVLAGSASASQVDTQYTYSSDGSDLTDELGPLHSTMLANGTTVNAREHTHTTYDEGAPSGGPYHLETTVTVGAQVSGTDYDVRTTKIAYDGQSNLGWTLLEPTSETVDPGTGKLNLKTVSLYDATSGEVIETRMPGNPNGGDAHATQTIVYSAGISSDPACSNRPEWAGLPCKTQPAAQPNTAGVPNIPVTTFAYNRLNQPTTTTATVGSSTQTVTAGYDAAGRDTSHATTSTDGTAVPTVTNTYDPTSGELTTTTDGTRTITRAYDSLGRTTGYTDADGNTSTTTYDLLDRPSTVNDGKGTQTWTYDSTTGLPAQMVDSNAGTFTPAYNADGQLVSETLPNGLKQQNTYDETGQLTHRSYVKVTNCSSNCTWLDFGGARSIHGEWLSQTGTLGTQTYAHDAAGRLTRVTDTPAGQGCTVRDYAYDADSNRSSQTTHAPGTGGVCDPGSSGTTKPHAYDAGDRLTDASTTYDNFGRTTTLSASNSGGGSLANTYYVDNMTRSASQDGITNTYLRDPAGRLRSVQTIGGAGQTTVLHYSDDSDSAAWQTETSDGSHWTRNVSGVEGDLAAIQDNTMGTKLLLEDLHADVVGTATLDPAATGPSATFTSDEFGNPQGHGASRYEWLGGKSRQTETASGVIEMGQREYVPAIGRFAQTDPVPGGSANEYDYANQDPVNTVDLDGTQAGGSSCNWFAYRPERVFAYGGWRARGKAWARCEGTGSNPALKQAYIRVCLHRLLYDGGIKSRCSRWKKMRRLGKTYTATRTMACGHSRKWHTYETVATIRFLYKNGVDHRFSEYAYASLAC